MQQPIPSRITDQTPRFAVKHFNTLLIDGSNLLEVCFRACKKMNSNGRDTGAVMQFFLQIKLLLRKGTFRYCYVFFDGENSGELRYRECVDYKANRDKRFSDEGLSEYMERFNATIRRWTENTHKARKSEDERESFFWQRDVIIAMCEELFIRVLMCDKTEADDLIAWYVGHKKPEERIVICTNDRDLNQLLHKEEDGGKDDVIIYSQKRHDFITTRNHRDVMGYHYSNVLLCKMLCGDASDNIKGVKGVGETTLLRNFPEIKDRPVSLDEVVSKAAKINEERVAQKKKPLVWAANIAEGVTDGCQVGHLYEINKRIINLSDPLMTDEAKGVVEDFMYAPLDPEDRSMENLYSLVLDAGIDEWRDEEAFGSFFAEFGTLIDKECRNSLF